MSQRLDKWLWFARFVKTRSLAAKLVGEGKVRVNGTKAGKPAAQVGPGDVLTFPQGRRIRVVRVVEAGTRRGPAAEARTLYDDLTPVQETNETPVPHTPRYEGKGRPTKKDRRDMVSFDPGSLE